MLIVASQKEESSTMPQAVRVADFAIARASPTLGKVRTYVHPELIERYKRELDLSEEAAQQLFKDTKLFLYICGTRPGNWSPTESVDRGWHEFLMYSRDYESFCREMFGRMVYHVPSSYLDPARNAKGRTWATYQVAKDLFGALSANWDVPERLRPKGITDLDGTFTETDPCSSSCGCGAACNGEGVAW